MNSSWNQKPNGENYIDIFLKKTDNFLKELEQERKRNGREINKRKERERNGKQGKGKGWKKMEKKEEICF